MYISATDSKGLCLLLFTQLFLKFKHSESWWPKMLF